MKLAGAVGARTFASRRLDFPQGSLSDAETPPCRNSPAESRHRRKIRLKEIRRFAYFRPDSFSFDPQTDHH
jgi:hypothetical protein